MHVFFQRLNKESYGNCKETLSLSFYVYHECISLYKSNCINGLRKLCSTCRLFLLFSSSQVEKCLSNHLIEPVELNVVVKRRLNLEKSDLPLIEVEGNLELFKVWICLISVFNFAII